MPGRFYGARRRFQRLGQIVNSNKNVISAFTAISTGAQTDLLVARAVDSAALATTTDVERGCLLKAIWLELWIYASTEAVVGVTHGIDAYLIKNPGDNLTPPIPSTTGSSNEKKFIIKQWKGLIGARTQGSLPYSWRGWIKIPKRYQRMGADDRWEFVSIATGSNALQCTNFIYKWYK